MTSEPFHDSKFLEFEETIKDQGRTVHGWAYISNAIITVNYSIPEQPELQLP